MCELLIVYDSQLRFALQKYMDSTPMVSDMSPI